jgi:tetratricopeptide (TPR) repeat protein
VPGGPASRILTEADVYLKYGLHQKALDHLQKILDSDPESPDALERIRDIRETLGDRTGAAEAAERVVRALLERGDEARIAAATARLRELDPSHGEVAVDFSPPSAEELPLPDDEPVDVALDGEEAPAPAGDEAAPAEEAATPAVEPLEVAPVPPGPIGEEGPVEFAPAGADAPVLVHHDDERPKPVGGEEGPAPVLDDESPAAIAAYAGIPLEDEIPPVPEAVPAPAPVAEEVGAPVPMTLGDDSPLPVDDPMVESEVAEPEREPTVAQALAPPPDLDIAPVDEVEEVDEVEADAVVEEARPPGPPPLAPVPPPPAADSPPFAVAPPPVPERSWPALDAELEEVAFYERQGLLEEALLAVRDLASAHPGHPEVEPVLTRLTELAAEEGARDAPAPAEEERTTPEPSPAPGEGSPRPEPGEYASTGTTGIFDLGAELSAELGPELAPTPTGEFQYSVADVFDQFKRGLEKTVRPDDSATKYDLGIAFQEMGMLDEALEQFRSALAGGDRKREVDILNMIGTCLGMKGLHAEAIEAYRQALRSEFLSGEAAKAVHFELGAAHEALGEPEVALWYFQKVAHVSPGYRGVAERAARLGGGPGVPPGEGAAGPAEKPPAGKRARKR